MTKSDRQTATQSKGSIIRNMQRSGDHQLSLLQWIVLCLICEDPTHGFAVSASLTPNSDLGRIWHVHKTLAYRAIDQLERLGCIRTIGQHYSNTGPIKSLVGATHEGHRLAKSWMQSPAAHHRDVRSELLIKLALLERANIDPADLLRRQQDQLLPIAAAIEDRLQETTGFEHTLALWRHESISATLRVLEAASARPRRDFHNAQGVRA